MPKIAGQLCISAASRGERGAIGKVLALRRDGDQMLDTDPNQP